CPRLDTISSPRNTLHPARLFEDPVSIPAGRLTREERRHGPSRQHHEHTLHLVHGYDPHPRRRRHGGSQLRRRTLHARDERLLHRILRAPRRR
ncbi:unnamed protein product, partial [Ectocarpus fasciculatus]